MRLESIIRFQDRSKGKRACRHLDTITTHDGPMRRSDQLGSEHRHLDTACARYSMSRESRFGCVVCAHLPASCLNLVGPDLLRDALNGWATNGC